MSETRLIVPENTDGTGKNRNDAGAKRKTRKPRLRGNRNNPNFAELGRPYRWQKGRASPNPGGRPKAQPITAALRELMEYVHPKENLTVAQLLAEALVLKALAGSLPHLDAIANRVEGMPTQAIQYSGLESFYQAEPGEPRQKEILGRMLQILLERSRIYGLPTPEIAQKAEAELVAEGKLEPEPGKELG